MFNELKIWLKKRDGIKRFDNTEAHPLNPRIRIIVNEEDQAVIHHPDVIGLLHKKKLSQEVTNSLQSEIRRRAQYEADPPLSENKTFSKIPEAIKKDANTNANAFRKTATPYAVLRLDDLSITGDISVEGESRAHYKKRELSFEVHADNNTSVRRIECYAENNDASTFWSPIQMSQKEMDEVTEKLKLAKNTDDRKSILSKYNFVALGLDEALIMKGMHEGLKRNEGVPHVVLDGYEGVVYRCIID